VKQGFDLDNDKIKLLIPYKNSKDLKLAIQRGIIKVVGRTIPKEKLIIEKENNFSELRNIIKEEVSKIKQPSSDNSKILELLEKTNKLLERSYSQENISKENTVVVSSSDEEDISGKTLKEIHARKVGKIIKNAEDNFTDDETQTVTDHAMTKNVSELENLL
jgi:N-acyl-D-aspartate/D-glutamate deacylase